MAAKKSSERDHGLSRLEQELESVSLEAEAARKERDKQRKELDSLKEEHTMLLKQKDQTALRKKLFADLQDLSKSVEKKVRQNQSAQEDLEQAKTHNRQLKRTLALLQEGVQQILEKSTQDVPRTEQERARAQKRQEILRSLFAKDAFNLNNMPSSVLAEEDEDEDIHDDDGVLYANKKNSRLNSIESMISTIEEMPPIEESMNEAMGSSSNLSYSHGRSTTRDQSRSSRSRSSGSRSSRNRSGSRKARRGRKDNKTKEDDSEHQSAALETPQKSNLTDMLEQNEEAYFSDGSGDTPRTCNTQDNTR